VNTEYIDEAIDLFAMGCKIGVDTIKVEKEMFDTILSALHAQRELYSKEEPATHDEIRQEIEESMEEGDYLGAVALQHELDATTE
jgi:hypothetical protein